MFWVCLATSVAEFALVHLTNMVGLAPLVVGPVVAGWQVALPLAFFCGLATRRALGGSFRSIWRGKLLFRAGLALAVVRSTSLCVVCAQCAQCTQGHSEMHVFSAGQHAATCGTSGWGAHAALCKNVHICTKEPLVTASREPPLTNADACRSSSWRCSFPSWCMALLG